MNKRERHHRILDELKASSFVRISTLADHLGISTETVRRDLDELSQAGAIDRAYGGATAPSPTHRGPSIRNRDPGVIEEFAKIGAAAAERVQAGQTVILSEGDIAQQTARELARVGIDLVVITNSATIAGEVATNPTLKALLMPGYYDPATGSVSGEETMDYLQEINADIAVVEAGTLTRNGVYEASPALAALKRTMLKRAVRRLLLLPRPTLRCRAIRKVCSLKFVDECIAYGQLERAIVEAAHEVDTLVSVVPDDRTQRRRRGK
jgi:DeoR/GlpR family transcriptional regulator of sugar metabolism